MVFPYLGKGREKSTRERERDTTRETQKSKDRSRGRGGRSEPYSVMLFLPLSILFVEPGLPMGN